MKKMKTLKTLAAIAAIIVFGVVAMRVLGSMKKEPATADKTEQALRVEAIAVQPEDVPVTIRGTGSARARNRVGVAPEVAGRVVEVHPDLEVGKVIPKGETLFVIDPRNYEANVKNAAAQAEAIRSSIARMNTQIKTDQDRLATLKRNAKLAEDEFQRRKRLLEEDEVGTVSGVDMQEQAFNAAQEAVQRLEQALAVYPIQIQEMEAQLTAAEAGLELSELNLERTRVVAEFDARVMQQSVEVGQYVSPGAPVCTLADDSILEIAVGLDSADAKKWLRFNTNRVSKSAAWFSDLEPVEVTVRWTEDPEGHQWTGTLKRVEAFSPAVRTLTVVVAVEANNVLSSDSALPLVDGMFCSVEIPGRTMKQVFRLPRWAVNFGPNTVYKSVGSRLRTQPIEMARATETEVFISEGLAPGDVVVTTRLVNPLENALLEYDLTQVAENTGSAEGADS
jgi:RND family efflux transporter MFP subunit